MNIMDRSKRRWIIALVAVIAFVSLTPVIVHFFTDTGTSSTERAIEQKLSKESESFKELQFDLIDPEEAPPALKEAVMLGYHIMLNTSKYAPGYAGDKLSCTNCHFAGGNTTGGVGGSISLAGIAAVYPNYNKRSETVITLEQRINSCFERSMNGKALPLESKEMIALVTYIHWISKNFPIYQPVPWRGLRALHTNTVPNTPNGAHLWETRCSLCHGKDGEGKPGVPAVWGEHSFNDGAGMHDLATLASFIHANMPYEEPGLSEEDALDVAAFIRQKPRPHYVP